MCYGSKISNEVKLEVIIEGWHGALEGPKFLASWTLEEWCGSPKELKISSEVGSRIRSMKHRVVASLII